MRNPTATGMREVLDQRSFKIPVWRLIQVTDLKHKVRLPSEFLAYEPSRTRSKVADMWTTQVIPTMADLIRTRKSLKMNKHMRKAVFRSGMEKLMIRFNQFTENIKAEFRIDDTGYLATATHYYVDIFRLNPIPDHIRFAPSCVAEVPEPAACARAVETFYTESAVEVDVIADDDNNNEATRLPYVQPSVSFSGVVTTIPDTTQDSYQSEDIPMVVATTIDDPSPSPPSRSSMIRNNDAACEGVTEMDCLRRELNELRQQNALLRSQVGYETGHDVPSAAGSARDSWDPSTQTHTPVSHEVQQLRREMEEMRQMMQQMVHASNSQQH
jgi:hypothetical protein